MSSLTLTEDQGGQTVPVELGDTIEIHLAENPTTGYRWNIETLGPGLTVELDRFHTLGTPLVPGAGGVHEWRIETTSKGSQPVRLRLWRDWEGDESVIRRFGVDIEVD